MHPQERDLINSVFDRLTGQPATARDPEAEALVHDRARQMPDAVYALAQAVCLQDLALRQAQARIAELERQAAVPRPAAAGSFLNTSNPWGGPPASVPVTAPPPAYAQPATGWGMPATGGGFLRGIAGTALGVAGGALLAEGISSLFSGSHGGFGGFGGGALAAGSERVEENVTVNNYYADQPAGGDGGGGSAEF